MKNKKLQESKDLIHNTSQESVALVYARSFILSAAKLPRYHSDESVNNHSFHILTGHDCLNPAALFSRLYRCERALVHEVNRITCFKYFPNDNDDTRSTVGLT